LIEAVGRERVILGFPGGGGKIGRLIVRYHILDRQTQPTMLGEPDGSFSPRLKEIAEIFEKAGFPAKISTNMDAWLVTHAALITPLANAIYMADGNPYRLAKTRDALVLLVRAVRENFEVLGRLKIPVTPERLRLIHFIPEPLLVGSLQLFLPSQKAEEYFASLANSSRDEMAVLSSEFYQLVQKSKSTTPSAVLLCAYLDAATPPLPSSSRQIPLQWRGTALLTIASGIMLAALIWLRMGARDET